MRTFPRVIELLQKELEKTGSVNRIVSRTGLNHNTITSYLSGRSEPTQDSLEKIARAYGRRISWLRGDSDTEPTNKTLLDLAELSPPKRQLWDCIAAMTDEKAENLLRILQP